MYDTERVGKIVSDLNRFFTSLDSFHIKGKGELQEPKTFYATSMLLFSILNRTIDLGEELVSAHNLGIPTTYKDIFFLLAKGKVITPDMGRKLASLVHDRNLLAHEYQDFSEKDVFEILQKVAIVRSFVNVVKRTVSKA